MRLLSILALCLFSIEAFAATTINCENDSFKLRVEAKELKKKLSSKPTFVDIDLEFENKKTRAKFAAAMVSISVDEVGNTTLYGFSLPIDMGHGFVSSVLVRANSDTDTVTIDTNLPGEEKFHFAFSDAKLCL